MQPFLTLGDLIADLCLDVERLPIAPGGHQTVAGLALGPGGAGNALVAAARLGLPAVALGTIGDDWVGTRVLELLGAEGVATTHVRRLTGGATRTAVRLRAGSGDQVFMGRPGDIERGALPPAWAAALETAGVILVDGWSFFHDDPDLILAGVQHATRAGRPVLFDPGPRVGGIDRVWLRTLTRSAAVILATEAELRALTQQLELNDLFTHAGLRAVIQKLGPEGCVISAGAERLTCPGYPVAALDATAAGDCFAAGVAWGLLTDQPWGVIGAVANAVGAAKALKVGTALAAPTHAEVGEVLRAHRPELARLFEWASPTS